MNKTYKVRVEIGAILEIDVVAGDEEEAESVASRIAAGAVIRLDKNQLGDRDKSIRIVSDGVVVREFEPYEDA